MNELMSARDLCKSFGKLEAVQNVSMTLASGDFIAVMGRSGSGKSTLLNLLTGLESPTSGQILFEDRDLTNLDEEELALWRREHIGLVFQSFHLIPTLSALENVAFPLYPTKLSTSERHQRAAARLEQVGLADRARHRPGQMSGGEQQRVAIARALVNRPHLIFADEPTGNLDSQTSGEVLQLLRRLNTDENLAILVITHDPEVAAAADRVLRMNDGRLEKQ
jgi:ABC-type lipoprotein export system ATPase subunit